MERLRELAELAKKLFPSKAREETGSYNYQEVANPELRQYLERFEEGVVQRIGPWPIRTTRAVRQVTFTEQKYDTWKLYEVVCQRQIIKFIPEPHGEKTFYYFNPDTLRLFSALAWFFDKNWHQTSPTAIKHLVYQLRTALGSHPLAELVHDPVLIDKKDKVREPKKAPPKPVEKPEKPKLDFSSGAFWTTPLGQEVKEFAINDPIISGDSNKLTTSEVAAILKLRSKQASSNLVSHLVRIGILAGAEKRGGTYRLNPEQALISGLAFLHFERGYSVGETSLRLRQLLLGTSLQPFAGVVTANLREEQEFFSAESPWRIFPLEPASTRQELKPTAQLLAAKQTKTEGEEGEERPVLNHVKPEEPVDKIPEINHQELKEACGWDKGEVERLLNRVPVSFDEFSFSGVKDPPPSLYRWFSHVYRRHA